MSPKLITVGKNWDNLSKAEKRAANSAIASINTMQKKADKLISTTLKWGTGIAAAGIGMGFAEAFNLETYRSQLETATKDTQRAAEVMTYAVKMASATPFESGELVKASAALEMAGLKSETYLTTLGDTAAGTNKSISDIQSQFVKAFATGTTGEFFDMINVSRNSFKEFAKSNKLATGTLEESQKALKMFLDQQFGGGMEKLSHTVKGAWATITDTAKISLTRIVGMGEDGTVRTGSALDKLREKMQSVSATLDKWMDNGQLDKIARELGNALGTVWDIGEKTLGTIFKFKDLLIPLGAFATGVWAITRAMTAFKTITEAVRVVMLILNGTLIASPVGLVAAALAALGLTAFGILNYKSTPEEHTSSSGREHGGGGGNFGTSENKTKPQRSKKYAPKSGLAAYLYDFGYIMDAYANGTQYHTGGLALVGERGPEIVNLPTGAKVTPAEKTAKLGGQTVVNNYITINGAQKSDEELADIVAKRILEVVDNT